MTKNKDYNVRRTGQRITKIEVKTPESSYPD